MPLLAVQDGPPAFTAATSSTMLEPAASSRQVPSMPAARGV